MRKLCKLCKLFLCRVLCLVALLLPAAACRDDQDANGSFGIARQRTSAQLRSFESCDELTVALRESVGEQARVALLQMLDQGDPGGVRGGWVDAVAAEDGAAPTQGEASGAGSGDASSAARTEGVDFSGTNNQEAGVDEADIAKTDGYRIYTLNGRRVEILSVPQFGELAHAGTANIEGFPSGMLLGNDRVVVFSAVYPDYLEGDDPLRAAVAVDASEPYGWLRSAMLTKLTVLNVADASSPVVEREIYIEGTYQTARRVEGTVRMVSYGEMSIAGLTYWPELPDIYWIPSLDSAQRESIWRDAILDAIAKNDALLARTPLEDFVPRIYERVPGATALQQHVFTEADCADFATANDSTAHGITSILSLDLFADTFDFDADHIVSNPSLVYASADTLVIAEPANDWWWYWDNNDWEEAANIHRFDIATAGLTRYTGSGRVDGTILNQFALSAYEGAIRVAATTGSWNRWWLEEPIVSDNHIFVLEGDDLLAIVGHVNGIGTGERLWSSRFVGDKAYLVTFRNMDPLWTVDLSDKTNPQIIGELEVPGVSTYIHPLGDYLLTIGYDGDENGLDWSVQISLFNVGDFSNPSLADKLSLAPTPVGDGWSNAWSEASYEHKAFQYWPPLAMLAVPLSSYRDVYTSTGTGTNTGTNTGTGTGTGTDTGTGTGRSTPAAPPEGGSSDGDAGAPAEVEDETSPYGGGWYYEYSSVLQLVHVDEAAGQLARYGAVDHSSYFNDAQQCWWSWRDVRRSFFLGDYVYAISDRGVTAHRVSDMSPSAAVELDGAFEDNGWCY